MLETTRLLARSSGHNHALQATGKRVHFTALRQHQLRLFKFFGFDAEDLLQRSEPDAQPAFDAARLASEIR